MPNSFANKTFLDNAMTSLLAYNNNAVPIALENFFLNQTQANYDALWKILCLAQDSIVSTNTANLGSSNGVRSAYKFRFLIASDDGTCVMDSSRADGASNGSTNYQGGTGQNISSKSLVPNVVNNPATGVVINANNFFYFQAKQVNENHHSRPEMLLALLSNSGSGYSERFSSSVSANLIYAAQRLGTTTQKNMGTIRVSLVDA